MSKKPEISIVIPCLNEESSISEVIKDIKSVITKNKLNAELIIVDNNSTDHSVKIIKKEISNFKQASLIIEKERGYGSAYLAGFEKASGKYLFFADSDNTYDFNEIPRFIKELKSGNDLVLGNRFGGQMDKDAMPVLNKHLGNPLLSFILRFFFSTKINDSQSGMRAIKKEELEKLNLRTTGMEFASEMIIKSIKRNLKIKEIPINYHKRKGNSKLRPVSDAWKHLRFMLLYSPLFLFLIPGIVLFLIGLISMLAIYFGTLEILGIKLYYHPMFISSLLMITGYQLVIFATFAKTYAITHLAEESHIMDRLYKYITIEKASILGILISIVGLVIYLYILISWLNSGFQSLNEIKNSIVALTFIVLGVQTIFSSFMLSILGIKEK